MGRARAVSPQACLFEQSEVERVEAVSAIHAMSGAVRRWLVTPVVEDFGTDRPFRLRRVSLLLLAFGWVTFLVSCLIGLYLVRHGVRLHTLADLWAGGLTVEVKPALQWALRTTEALGAASFFAGLLSVTLFDKRDRIPVWRCE